MNPKIPDTFAITENELSSEVICRGLLISPPVFDFYCTPARMEPLGLYYLKKSMEDIPGLSVDIYDAFQSGRKKKIGTPDCFSYLENIYTEDESAFSLLKNYFRFGDSISKIAEFVRDGKYHFVAISSNFTGYHPDTEKLVNAVKEKSAAVIILGGWAVWAEPDAICADTAADYIIPDDGLSSLPALIKKIFFQKKELNPPEKKQRKLFSSESKNNLFMNDFPERHAEYFFKNKRISRVVLSRGCVHECGFCSIPRRYKFERRPLDAVACELEYLSSIGVEIADFEDDNFFAGSRYAEELIHIMKQFSKRGMRFAAMNGITAPNLAPFTEDVIEAGFIELNISLVTGNDDTASSISRPAFKEAVESIAWKAAGRIETIAFVIGGLPGADADQTIQDILFLAGLPVKIGFSPLYLLPGIDMFGDIGIPKDRRLMRGSALYKFGKNFSREDIASLWKFVRMINYLKQTDGDSVDEEIEYFCRSLKEKRWYRKLKSGDWAAGFDFSIDFPRKINICSMAGHIKKII